MNQFFFDILANVFQMIMNGFFHFCNVTVAGKCSILIIMSRWKRHDLCDQSDQVFRFTCKQNRTELIISVIQRTNADGISGRNVLFCFSIIQNQSKLCIQRRKHIYSIFLIQRKKNLTIWVAFKRIFIRQSLPDFFKSIDLTVTDSITISKSKRLHSFWMQPHNS